MVFRYRKEIIIYDLIYFGYPSIIEYDFINIKLTFDFVFPLGEGAISLKSTKQSLVAKSTMKVELVALDLTYYEVEWINFLSSYGTINQPTNFHK